MEQGSTLAAGGAHAQGSRLVGLDPVDAVDPPGQPPVQARLPRLGPHRPEAADHRDLVRLHDREAAQKVGGEEDDKSSSRDPLRAHIPPLASDSWLLLLADDEWIAGARTGIGLRWLCTGRAFGCRVGDALG